MSKAARIALYGLVLWAPWPLGGNRPLFWAINGLWASLVLLLFLLGETRHRGERGFDWRPAAFLSVLLALWAGWMAAQAIPGLPAELRHPLWALVDASGAISVSPAATLATIAEVLPVVFLGVVAMRVAADRRRGRFLLGLIAANATAVGLWGVAALRLDLPQVLLIDSAAFPGFLTGPFVGRSAAATYLAIGLAASASLAADSMVRAFSDEGPANRFRAAAAAFRGALLPAGASLVIVIAILQTGSRGGVIAALAALAAVLLLSLRSGEGGARALRTVFLLAFAAVLAVGVVAGRSFFARLAGGVSSEERLLAYQDTLRMIEARPLLGHGAGSFAEAFPQYHDAAPAFAAWLRAHNTYLQLAAEIGVPAAALLLLGLAAFLIYLLSRTLRLDRPAPAAIAALGAALGVGLQSMVDFSLQVQAVGLTVVVLLGAGLGDALRPRRSGSAAPSPAARVAIPAEAAVVAPAAARAGEAAPRGGFSTTRVAIPKSAGETPVRAAAVPAPAAAAAGDGLRAVRSLAPDDRVYVFGDLHGRLDLLRRLEQAVAGDCEARPPPAATLLVGLGDYIDRGPDSAAVLDRLIALSDQRDCVFLRGNHEQMLIDFLEDPSGAGPIWMHNGAAATVRSYGVPFPAATNAAHYKAMRDALVVAMPPAQLVFLQRLPFSLDTPLWHFAHAGARAGVPLAEQRTDDLLWTRMAAGEDPDFAKVVIHGHSPAEAPFLGRNRINLDTGAWFTDRLTCLALQGSERRLVAV